MSVAKNAAQDLAGEVEQGHQRKDFEEKRVKGGGMGVPNYNKSTSIPVDELKPESA